MSRNLKLCTALIQRENTCVMRVRLKWPRRVTENRKEATVPKAYVLVIYRSAPEPKAFAEYGQLALPAVAAGGGRILARGPVSKVYEAGMDQRVTLIEFDSLEQAITARESVEYQAALSKLGKVERDVRVVEAFG